MELSGPAVTINPFAGSRPAIDLESASGGVRLTGAEIQGGEIRKDPEARQFSCPERTCFRK